MEIDNEFTEVINTKLIRRKNISTSYGLIVHTIHKNKINYIVGQMRDTIAYKEFLRGTLAGEEERYINLMTKEEKLRILTYSFEDLWNDLFVNHQSMIYKSEFPKAKESFGRLVVQYRTVLEDDRIGTEKAPWIFPKGHANRFERELETAKREWEEETQIPKDFLKIYDVDPIEELYTGYDGNIYRSVYFIAYINFEKYSLTTKLNNLIETKFRTSISSEIDSLAIGTYDTVYTLLNESKQKVLRMAHSYLIFNLDREQPKTRHSF